MLHKLERSHGRYYGLLIEGPISHTLHDPLIEDLNDHIRQHGHMGLLLKLSNLSGYSFKTYLHDLEFFTKHRKDFFKIAIVADHSWWRGLVPLENVMTPWEEKYFDIRDIDAAWSWLES